MNKWLMRVILLVITALSLNAWADSAFVGKVYHPYVLPLENEIEWRMGYNDEKDHPSDDTMSQRFALGHSISERATMEFYVIAERVDEQNLKVSGFELETRWMLTEQGEYFIDWGALFVIEKAKDENEWKLAAGLLAEKEFGKFSTTANLFLIHEIQEKETNAEFRMQHRYRLIPQLQPGIELFVGDEFYGMGPSFTGIHRLDGQEQIKWEAAFIFGLDKETTDRSFRFGIEYEF